MKRGTYATGKLVTVFGASGFVGRYVVQALVKRGYRVRAAVRRPNLAGHLQPLGWVGQVQAVAANVRMPESVARAAAGADAVVNLAGIKIERGRQGFAAVNEAGAGTIAAAARVAGVPILVHVSALGADADSRSGYFRSKAAGEAAVLDAYPDAVILRPSAVFGPEDAFFNRLATLARYSPALPVIGGRTEMQPVYAGDVGEAVARAVDGAGATGAIYELGGPEILTIRDCMRLLLDEIGRKRLLAPVPEGAGVLKGAVLQRLPGAFFGADEARQLQVPMVVSEGAIADGRTLTGLGIRPETLAAILPTYLGRYRRAAATVQAA